MPAPAPPHHRRRPTAAADPRRRRGRGLLAPQAEAFAARGRRVIWYDRRGTGGEPPRRLAGRRRRAARRRRRRRCCASSTPPRRRCSASAPAGWSRSPWRPATRTWSPRRSPGSRPPLGMLPAARSCTPGIMAPIEAHLAAHPGDWTGAYRVMLDVLSEGRADHRRPPVVRASAATPRPRCATTPASSPATRSPPASCPRDRVTVAVGAAPARCTRPSPSGSPRPQLGRPAWSSTGADDHEVYLSDPPVLAAALAARSQRTDGAASRS